MFFCLDVFSSVFKGLPFIPTRRPLEHLIWFPCFPEDGPPVFSLILQAPNTRLIYYFSAKLTQSPSLLPATPGHGMSCQFCLTIKLGLWRLQAGIPPIPSGIFHLTSTSLFSLIHVWSSDAKRDCPCKLETSTACLIHAVEGSSRLCHMVKLFGIISPKLTMSKWEVQGYEGTC